MEWIARIAPVFIVALAVLSALVTEQLRPQSNLERLLSIIVKLDVGPVRKTLEIQSIMEARRLAAIYRVPSGGFLVPIALLLLAGEIGWSASRLYASGIDSGLAYVSVPTGIFNVILAVYYVAYWRRIRAERKRFIREGCPDNFEVERLSFRFWKW